MQANPPIEPQSTEERILEAAVQEFMTKGYAGARTTATIENHQDFIAANPELPRFMINEVLNRPDRMPKVIERLKHHTPLVVQSLQRQIDEYADRGLCRRVDAGMLMLDIVSLNIFPFSAKPMVNALLGGMMEDREAFVEARKKENLETIMRKLKP